MANWEKYLGSFGRRLLGAMGIDVSYGLPSEYNPITQALKSPDFVEKYEHIDGFSRSSLSKVATVCQMKVFDAQGGPEGDGECKAIRRHWYSYWKGHFAQPLAKQLGDVKINAQGIEEMNDLVWVGRLSQTYAHFVDNRGLTYKDLWVDDQSRMMSYNWQTLFRGCNIMLAVEKDSLFGDFQAAAKAIGATSVYSGKGKSSKAAIEKVLREHFRWSPDYDPFWKDPLVILHISDHDYDGEAVIGPTFAEQARRYTDNIIEVRVGIKPESVLEKGYTWDESWYNVKVSNKGYQSWAEKQALFLAQCSSCNHIWPVLSIWENPEDLEFLNEDEDPEYYMHSHRCPKCGADAYNIDPNEDTPHGFEVEAMRTRDYYSLIVDALCKAYPFEYIVERLRKECRASAESAAEEITRKILERNRDYQALLSEFDRLEDIKREFEDEVKQWLVKVGDPLRDHFVDVGEEPEYVDFVEHVERAGNYASPWRSFSEEERTQELVELLEWRYNEIAAFATKRVEW